MSSPKIAAPPQAGPATRRHETEHPPVNFGCQNIYRAEYWKRSDRRRDHDQQSYRQSGPGAARAPFTSCPELYRRHATMTAPATPERPRPGCGPLIGPNTEAVRPLRLQVFERVRAAGLMPRVDIAKDLGVSPASVTTVTSRLIRDGYLEEVAVPRDAADSARGRPPVALGVRGAAHHVVGIKLSEREHTATLLDFAGTLLADAAVPAMPGPGTADAALDAADALVDAVCTAAGLPRGRLAAVGIGLPGVI